MEIDVAEFPGNCSLLRAVLSSSAIKALGIIMDSEKQTLTVRAYQSTNLPLKESSGGHPILLIYKLKEKDIANMGSKFVKKSTSTTTARKWPTTLEVQIAQTEEITVKKGARKMLIKSAKDTIVAYQDGIKERVKQLRPTWHVDKFKQAARRKFSIMETCTWAMLITTLAMASGWVGWQPVTVESGYDFTTSKGISVAKKVVEKANPDVIVFTWPCSPW